MPVLFLNKVILALVCMVPSWGVPLSVLGGAKDGEHLQGQRIDPLCRGGAVSGVSDPHHV